jgi:hypothetical protein
MDIEDYYFQDSEVPYSIPRTQKECTQLLVSDKVDMWLKLVSLPIIEIDGLKKIDENLDYIKQIYKEYFNLSV